MAALPASSRGAIGVAFRELRLAPTYPSGSGPVGSTAPWGSVEARAGLFSRSRARRNHPLTLHVASPGTCRPKSAAPTPPSCHGPFRPCAASDEFPRRPKAPFSMRPTKAAASQSRSAFRRRVSPRAAETERLALPAFTGASSPAALTLETRATRPSLRTAGFARAPERRAAAGAAGRKNPSPASDMHSRVGSRRPARPAPPCRFFTGAERATCRPSTSAI